MNGVRVENPLFLSDLELKENPAFLKQYRERQVVIDGSDVPDNELALENDSGKLILTYYERIK